MQVIEISQPGGPEVLRLVQRDAPRAGAGEALIRVRASGINRPDVFQRQGHYPPPPGASDLPGLEVAGEIIGGDASALQCAGFSVGQRVCALLAGGGYAEQAVAPIAQLLPVPEGWSDIEAASLPETYFTVWANVFQRGRLKAGESLLVQGGTSGIGVAAIQLAKALGATVYATAGSADKCAACIQLGADVAINYREQDFVAVVNERSGAHGVDVILDMVAGDYVSREVEALAEDGRLLIIAVLGGTHSQFNSGLLLRRRLTIGGATLRSQPVEVKGAIAQELREHVWPLLSARKIRPVIHAVLPAREAAKAHALMESSQHVGKIVLDWQAGN